MRTFFQHLPNVLANWADWSNKLWNILGSIFSTHLVLLDFGGSCINQPFFLQTSKLFGHFREISIWVRVKNLEFRHHVFVVRELLCWCITSPREFHGLMTSLFVANIH